MSPNYNYLAGRRFEYKRKKAWEHNGYVVLRTAGSHGPFDLVAIQPGVSVSLIQCKRVETKAQARKLLDQFRSHPPLPAGNYEQYMEVYVAKTREFLTGGTHHG